MKPSKKLNAKTIYYVLSGTTSLLLTMIFTVSMIYQVTKVGLDPLQLVLVGTTLEISAFLFEIPTGVVADLYSRRLSIIVGQMLVGVGFIVEGAIPAFGAVLLAQVIWGFGYTFTSGATEAWLVDEVGEDKAGPIFLRAAQIGQVTAIAGVIFAVALGSIEINLPIVTGGALLIGLGVFLALAMPETGFKPVPRESRSTWESMWHTFGDGLKLVRGRSVLMTMVGIGLLYGLYSEGYDRLYTPHLLNDFSFPALAALEPVVWFGLIRLVGMPLSILVVEVIRRRVDTTDTAATVRALLVISGLMVVALAGFALAGSFLLALAAMFIFNALRNTTFPLFSAWSNQHIDSSVRATVLSMFGQVDAIGQIGGGPPIGLIGSALGIRAALLGSTLLLSPVLLLYLRALKQGRVPSPAEAVS